VLGVISAFFTKNPPKEFIEEFVIVRTASGQEKKQYTTGEMLRTKEYYIIAASMLFAVPAYMLINPIFGLLGLERGVAQSQIMATVMIASVLHAMGRLVAPMVSDKLGRKKTLIILYIANIAAVLGMIVARGGLYLVLFPVIAFIYGGFMGTYPVVSTDYFGTKHSGINYAVVMIGFGLACVLCPFLSKAVQATGIGTALSFAIAAGACIIGIILVLILKKND
jgi:OFA family oxalate/formate antiporter-like MFS transporter